MSDGLRVNADEYERFARKVKTVDRVTRNGVRKRLRDSAKQFGPGIVSEGAEELPRRGGLASHVASKGRNPTVSITSTGARLVLGKKKGPQIGRMNDGNLRHPLYGNRKRWITQSVPAGTFTEAAEKRLPEMRDEVAKELTKILGELG